MNIAFLIFNRPYHTERVFEQIRSARPTHLFVIADGPRESCLSDVQNCAAARAVTEKIDWPCQVQRNYSPSNLGCGRRVSSGLDWVFEQVEEAIILEDDCLPHPSFFPFCAELLVRYRNETRVGLISGSHHLSARHPGETSYYFCRYGNIWGWATWRRAWRKFDFKMTDWPLWRDAGNLEQLFERKSVSEFWRKIWNDTAAGLHDTWDYQWTFCYLRHGMLGILPQVALIENIGFGAEASHTGRMKYSAPPVEAMQFPLQHPLTMEPDLEAEYLASRKFFSRKTFHQRVVDRIKRLHSALGGQVG